MFSALNFHACRSTGPAIGLMVTGRDGSHTDVVFISNECSHIDIEGEVWVCLDLLIRVAEASEASASGTRCAGAPETVSERMLSSGISAMPISES